MSRRSLLILGLAVGLLMSFGGVGAAQTSPHLALGLPMEAKTDAKKPDKKNFLIVKPLFALSYNSKTGTPNWVSWRLVKEDTGTTARPQPGPFHPDTTLPPSLFQVLPKHYLRAGFDRGHMCPNADRDKSKENATATFVMTNMVPQSPELNRESWAKLEAHCRELADKGKELYIVAGPAGKGGWGLIEKREKGKKVERTTVFRSTLADGKITVPAMCWKVVLAIDPGPGEPSTRVTKDSMLFAVIMHNDQAPKKWEDHVAPVTEVEKLTGFSFFSKAPADVLDELTAASQNAQTRRIQRALTDRANPFRFTLAPKDFLR